MSVVSVNEIAGAEGSFNDKFERTYTRSFRVITSSNYDGSATAAGAVGIPRLGDPYSTATENDYGSFCKDINSQQDDDNPKIWVVRAEYGPPDQNTDQEENPLARPIEVTWSFAQFTRIAEKDINGKALLNSAGQYFDPPPEIDDSRPVLVATRNEAAFIPTLAINYQDAVNSDYFLGFSPGQVKVANISSTKVTAPFVYWQTTYEFHFRRDGWALQILDQGRYYKNGDGSLIKIPEFDEDGNNIADSHVIEPTPLDGAGGYIAAPTPDNAVFLSFHVYKPLPFSAFNF